MFDAGALMLWRDDLTWAKLCFEYSPRGEPMIVSVVTRGASDDCNSIVLDRDVAWLRIARTAHAYASHVSPDGNHSTFVRHFRFAPDTELDVGFGVQSPTGDGCSATFSQIRFEAGRLLTLRVGA